MMLRRTLAEHLVSAGDALQYFRNSVAPATRTSYELAATIATFAGTVVVLASVKTFSILATSALKVAHPVRVRASEIAIMMRFKIFSLMKSWMMRQQQIPMAKPPQFSHRSQWFAPQAR